MKTKEAIRLGFNVGLGIMLAGIIVTGGVAAGSAIITTFALLMGWI